MDNQELEGDIRNYVRQRYGEIAKENILRADIDCCAAPASCCGANDPDQEHHKAIQHRYDIDITDLPVGVTDLSLGCGDPVTLASLEAGQTVLDLGSGGGIDCFLAARQVGPTGMVIGVDMTAEMVERARATKEKLWVQNVDFRLGEIEQLPVEDNSVDVIISNCVINLSPDKGQVLREAYRVLKPGGRLAISDIVTEGEIPQEFRDDLDAWAGCIAGAISAKEYIAVIETAGFVDVSLEPYGIVKEIDDSSSPQVEGVHLPEADASFSTDWSIFSAKINARKPLDD